MIREYLGFNNFLNEPKHNGVHTAESLYYNDPISPNSLMVEIEGIHVGPTRNYTRYTEQALKSSKRSWTHPYLKPLIMHHNEKDGKIIGRIHRVEYVDKKTYSGTGALVFTTNVPDKEGMEQIEDGRLLTVSVGIIGHDVRCSICGHNIAEHGECEHERGAVYDGEICYWDIYEMEGKELSYVIVPSDIYAKNTKFYRPKQVKRHISESANNVKGVSKKMTLTEAEIQELQKEVVTLREMTQQQKEDMDELKLQLEEAREKAKPAEQLQADKARLEKELKEAQDTIKEKEEALKEEKELRENLETQLVELNKEKKIMLAENYALLRKLTGKSEIPIEQIQERSQESLNDAIKDLKEELENKIQDPIQATEVTDPTITESIDNNVKKPKSASNIDLVEGLNSLFDSIVGRHN